MKQKPPVPTTTLPDYPGQSATASQILQLAEEYRKAAKSLVRQGRRGALVMGSLSAIGYSGN